MALGKVRGAMGAAAISVRVVKTASELNAMREDWERLHASARITSIFETFDWQSLWWRHYGQRRELRLLIATTMPTDNGNGKPIVVGILPLYIQVVETLRYPVRLLRFVGVGGDTTPDDLGPILSAPPHEEEVARALADAVLKLPGWDVLALSDMQSDCPFTGIIAKAVADKGHVHRTGVSEKIALLALPKSYEDWLATLHRERRYRVRHARRKFIAAHPSTRFFVWSDGQTLSQGIERLGELHRRRWQSVGKPHKFTTREYLGFHHDVMTACFHQDRLRFYCLEVSGKIVAAYYFYRFRNTVYLMQSGFDPELANVKPGQVLLGYVIEHAIEEGFSVLDFLRGDHQYKNELASGMRETVFLTAFRRRPGAWVYRTRKIHLPAAKAAVRSLVTRLEAVKQRYREAT